MNQQPIITFSSKQSKLHEWIYDIAAAICYDREYCYRVFAEAFRQIVLTVLDIGGTAESGSHRMVGLKSDYDALLSWYLPQRLTYSGFHGVIMECVILNKRLGCEVESHRAQFELSLGEQAPLDTVR